MSVAYQTSGSIAVSDEEALRFAEFADDFSQAADEGRALAVGNLRPVDKSLTTNVTLRKERIKASLENKLPGQVQQSLTCFSQLEAVNNVPYYLVNKMPGSQLSSAYGALK